MSSNYICGKGYTHRIALRLSILVIILLIGSASSGDAAWQISSIDNIGNVGGVPSIAIDSNRKVHISYADYTNGDLKYATNASGSWTIYTVDSAGNVGDYNSIAIDSRNKVHISYRDATNQDLKYATNSNGNWITYTIDSSGMTGWDTSIAIDSNDKVHISYKSESNGDLKYATNSSGSWVVSTLDNNGWDGAFSSISIDHNDKVHISYYDQSSNKLQYATNAAGSWTIADIDNVGDGWDGTCSLSIDSNNKVHISYYDLANGNLKHATNALGSWATYTIDSTGVVGKSNAIIVDLNNKPHISYYDTTNDRLKYATTNASNAWITYPMDSSGYGYNKHIATDSANKVHVAYYDRIAGDLKYATLNSSTDQYFSYIYPRTVLNKSDAKIHIYGTGFSMGMQVNLSKNDVSITQASQVVYSSPTMLVATFDLSSIMPGTYDITVVWPDNQKQMLESAIEISSYPPGVILEDKELSISGGSPRSYEIEVPLNTTNLFVTLQKTDYPRDPHYSWYGILSISHDGQTIAQNTGIQDQILHLLNPEPGNYTISISSTQNGRGNLTAWTTLPVLPIDTWIVDTIYRPYGSVYHQIDVPSGQSALTFNAEAMGAWSQFHIYYEQFGGNQRWISSLGPYASLTIPNPQAGKYIVEFIDTQAISGNDQKRDVLLRAGTQTSSEPMPVYVPAITGITPQKGGNTGTVTIEIKGAFLEKNASVTLEKPGNIISAVAVNGTSDKRTLTATFNLLETSPDPYSLVVTNPDGTRVTSPVPFVIEQGGYAKLWTEIVGREEIRIGRPATYVIKYGNSGNIDMPAPLLLLSTSPLSTNTYIKFGSSPEWLQMNGKLTAFGAGPKEKPNILPAGSSFSITVQVKTQETGSFTLNLIPYGGDPTFKPPVISSITDAFSPEPGLPISFGRSFPGGTSSYIGAFGYGWVHTYDTHLELMTDGNIGLKSGDRFDLILMKNGTNTYTGEKGYPNLTRNMDGTYQLKNLDGTEVKFRSDLRLDSIRDLNSNRLNMIYDAQTRLSEIRHTSGDNFTLEYNGNNRITGLTDHSGRITAYAYDPSGTLLTSITAPDGAAIQYNYLHTENGEILSSITHPDRVKQMFQFDGENRISEMILNDGKEPVRLSYDTDKRSTIILDANGSASKIKVSEYGKAVQIENPLGFVSHYTYDEKQNLITATDSLGNSQHFVYDDRNNINKVTDQLNHEINLEYDQRFNSLSKITDPKGNAINFTYDDRGNIVTATYPDADNESMEYDATGNLIGMTTRKGDHVIYSYNTRGQVTKKDYPDGSSVTYGYDGAGNMISAVDATGTISMAYNLNNQLTRIEYPNGHWFNYTYDDAGILIGRTAHDGFNLTYQYDSLKHLTSVSDSNGTDFVRYRYNQEGRLAKKELRNGAYTTYDYDKAGQVIHLKNYNMDGSTLSQFDYTYDPAGNPVSMNTLEGTYQYEYDQTGQMTRVTYPDGQFTNYSYDAVGNRISSIENTNTTAYTTNAMNQYMQVGSTTYSYDANGNIISANEAGKTTTYEYDTENRLTRVTSPEGTWENTYDTLGNRIGVTHNGQQIQYDIDPLGLGNVVAEYDGNGTLISRYNHGIGLISKIDATGKEYTYHFNPTGHTMELTDPTGIVVNQYQYTPFGEYREKEESTPNPFRYVGEFGVQDDDNGLYYMRMRYYSSNIGRFTNEDPLMIYGGDLNLYKYVENNPIISVDPLGGSSAEPIHIMLNKIYHFGISNPITRPFCYPWIHIGKKVYEKAIGTGEYYVEKMIHYYLGKKVVTKTLYKTVINSAPKPLKTVVLPGGYNLLPKIGGGVITGILWDMLFPTELGKDFEDMVFDPVKNDWIYPNSKLVSQQHIDPRSSIDPEDKFGPRGFDHPDTNASELRRYIRGDPLLKYRIEFWNNETATANVSDVDAYDQLDSDLNWSTFRFTEVGFTNWTVNLEPGQYFNIYVDPRPDINLLVNIEGMYDPETGRANLTYHSLDPVTLQTPEDPLAGFLPPIGESGREVGWFSYSVEPEPGLITGTTIDNQAWVNFDYTTYYPAPKEAPWINTIDAGKPSSSLTALLVNQSEIQFTFTGNDDADGSGVRDYTIYISDNGGQYLPAMNHITQSSVSMTGLPGHTYSFYSIAMDNVGNAEDTKTNPDGTIVIPQLSDAPADIMEISFCTNIVSPGEYVLNQSIINSSSSSCINITTSDVIFDGAGYTIDGLVTSTNGIFVYNSSITLTNVTIKNIKATDWYNGIHYRNAQNGSLINNNANSNNYGIYLVTSSNNKLNGNNASNNNRGIFVYSSSNNNMLSGNNVSNNNAGIYLYSSSNNNMLSRNNASNNSYGIYLSLSSNNNTLSSNIADSNINHGIYLDSSSNNTTLSGNNASNNNYGIYLDSSSNNTISGNNASNNNYGIHLSSSINNTISGNIANYNNYTGLDLSSSNNNITGNNASNNNVGIYLYYSSNNTIRGNNASNNDNGILLISSGINTLRGNIANFNNNRGIHLYSSSNNTLDGNNAFGNHYGIYLESSANNNTLSRNNASNNHYGTYSLSSHNNTISSNIVNYNNDEGMYLYSSSNNTISGNIASYNTYYGLDLSSSSNNFIYDNIFNNTNNFYFSGSNINKWNITRQSSTNIIGGPFLGGNFWAHPNGTGFSKNCADSNKDGICDSNYTLTSGNVDYSPLTIPTGYGYISGKVMNNSIGIDGAVVTTNTGNTTNTDASGMYSLLAPAGAYNLTVTSMPRFYINSSIVVNAISGITVSQDIELVKKPMGNITGIVKKV